MSPRVDGLTATPQSILDSLRDRNQFGAHPAFTDLESWRSWTVYLRALYGLPITDPDDLFVWETHTLRAVYETRLNGYRESVVCCGRQSGKSTIASLIIAFEALMARPERDRRATYCALIAQDSRASVRILMDYLVSMFRASPLLEAQVVEWRKESLTLRNGTVVGCYPARAEAVRGLRLRCAVLDELAHYRSSDWSPTDAALLTAVRPALTNFQGRLVVLSSPYSASGALWDLHKTHHGRDDSPVLSWQSGSVDMNPGIPTADLERARVEDPEAYQSEWLGQFRSGLSQLFDNDTIENAVEPGRLELPPVKGTTYHVFVDVSGGRRDAYTMAVAHREEDECVVDLVRGWKSPLDPRSVTREVAGTCGQYGVTRVTADRYSAAWATEAFNEAGLRQEPSKLDKSALYLAALGYLNSKQVRLPDHPDLIRELRGLERRRGATRDRIDHRPNAFDDFANAVCGAMHLVLARQTGVSWADLYPREEIEAKRRARGFDDN